MFSNCEERIVAIMKFKQVQKREEWCSLYCKYGLLFLITTLTAVCLTGCGAVYSDQVNDSADQAKNMVNQVSPKPGMQNQTPDIPYSDQIDIIMQNKDTWCFTMPADAEEEYGENESDYYYWITDMDLNGYLEVISSSTTGNGSVFYNDYYEVSQDGNSLTELKTDEREDAPAADLWYMGEYSQGYYDGKTDTYHYPQLDHTHGSAVDTSDAQLDTVLADGAVNINTISFVESEGHKESVVVEYYAGDRAEKLGEVKEPLDETTEEFTHAQKQESEYDKQLETLYEQYYEGMQEFTVTSHKFQSVDEITEYKKPTQFTVVSDEILRKRVEESWNSFGIHFPNDNAPANPFLPKTATDDAEVSYLLGMLSEGKATMQMQEELRGNDSVLYLVTYCDPREVSNRELSIYSEKEEKEYVKEQFKETYFYLWVTDTQIYYISGFYFDEDDFDIDPYDDVSEDDYQKARLVFYHEIPEYARLVCQEDALEKGLEGVHQRIEKHGEDICCYLSYTSKGEGYEAVDIMQLVWKRGEGLIAAIYATHSAGGGGKFFWKEAYLEQEHKEFDIDKEIDD